MPNVSTAPGSFRRPSRRLGALRRASLAGMERYSQFVRVMKKALPAAAAVVALAVVVLAVMPRQMSRMALSWEKQSRVDNDLTMIHPKLSGSDEDGSPFLVLADKAVQDGASALRVKLSVVDAKMMMRDGLWVRLESPRGYLNSEMHQLDVFDRVKLTADGGYEAYSTSAHFDLVTGVVSGNHPISGRGPFGTYRADGFVVHKVEKQLELAGHVSMWLHAAAPATGAAPARSTTTAAPAQTPRTIAPEHAR